MIDIIARKLKLSRKLTLMLLYTLLGNYSINLVPIINNQFFMSRLGTLTDIANMASVLTLFIAVGALTFNMLLNKFSDKVVFIGVNILRISYSVYFLVTYTHQPPKLFDFIVFAICGYYGTLNFLLRNAYIDTSLNEECVETGRRFQKLHVAATIGMSIVLVLLSFSSMYAVWLSAVVVSCLALVVTFAIFKEKFEVSFFRENIIITYKKAWNELRYSRKLLFLYLLTVFNMFLMVPYGIVMYAVSQEMSVKYSVTLPLVALIVYGIDYAVLQVTYKLKNWVKNSFLSLIPSLIILAYLAASKFTHVITLIPLFFAAKMAALFLDRTLKYYTRRVDLLRINTFTLINANIISATALVGIGKLLKSVPLDESLFYFGLTGAALMIPVSLLINSVFKHQPDSYTDIEIED